MRFFQNRRNAVIIFVVVVIVFSLIGCHLSLNRACREVEDAFFDKTLLDADDYYTCPGDQLENCVDYANRLLTVLNGPDTLSDAYAAVRDSRAALDEALEARDISGAYAAAQALAQAVEDADAQVQAGADVSGGSDDYDAIVADLRAALDAAEASPYNDLVNQFIETTVQVFPTNILRRLSFVTLPEKYM